MDVTTTTRASKWGNSIGVRLSARVAAKAGITEHTEISINAGDDTIVLSPIKSGQTRRVPIPLKSLLKKVRKSLTKEDREWLNMKPVGREIL